MPIYEYTCQQGHDFERYLPVAKYLEPQLCECGLPSFKRVSKTYGYVQPDICYDSPIDGRHITSKHARIEDLARNDCVPYDPEMKTDAKRRRERADKELDDAVDKTIDAEISRMPARKIEKLTQELRSGATVEPVRLAGKSI